MRFAGIWRWPESLTRLEVSEVFYNYHHSLWGILVLIADVWAIVNIVQSQKETGTKVLWTVVVILLPVLGFILWLIFGPRTGRG